MNIFHGQGRMLTAISTKILAAIPDDGIGEAHLFRQLDQYVSFSGYSHLVKSLMYLKAVTTEDFRIKRGPTYQSVLESLIEKEIK